MELQLQYSEFIIDVSGQLRDPILKGHFSWTALPLKMDHKLSRNFSNEYDSRQRFRSPVKQFLGPLASAWPLKIFTVNRKD
jgi:hypothetical protein